MSQETAEREVSMRDVLNYLVRKIIASNKFGLTIKDLAAELMSCSRPHNMALSLDPDWTLYLFLDDYVAKGELEYGKLTMDAGTYQWLRPTAGFSFVPDEAMERLIGSEGKCKICDKTSEFHLIGLSGYTMSVPSHKFTI